jgi:hypothetical protein
MKQFVISAGFLLLSTGFGNKLFAAYNGGASGTEADPYPISYRADTEQLATAVNAGEHYSGVYFRLTRNLTGADETLTASAGNSETTCLSGIFDGDGHEIAMNATGTFDPVENATIKNPEATVSIDTVSSNPVSGTNKNGKDGQDATRADLRSQSWLTATLGWNFTDKWCMPSNETWPKLQKSPTFAVRGTVSASSADMGSVNPSDTVVAWEEPVEFTATPATGHRFVQWQEDGSRDNPRTVTLTQDTMLTAVFTRNGSYRIMLHRDPQEGGTVSGEGSYAPGTKAGIRATPATGYRFVQWREDGSRENPRTVTVTQDTTFTALFAPEGSYRIILHRDPQEGGTVSGAGSYAPGTKAEIGATAAAGYHFVRWKEDRDTKASRTVTLTQDTTLTALFMKGATASETYQIFVKPNDVTMGMVFGGGTYEQNEVVEITATAKSGYHFVRWHDGSTENPRTITVVSQRIYTAEFAVGNVGITDPVPSAGAAVVVYPNPVRNVLRWQSSVAVEQIRIYNLSGQQVKYVASPGTQVNVSDLPAGLYFVRIITADGNETLQKIIH